MGKEAPGPPNQTLASCTTNVRLRAFVCSLAVTEPDMGKTRPQGYLVYWEGSQMGFKGAKTLERISSRVSEFPRKMECARVTEQQMSVECLLGLCHFGGPPSVDRW